MQYIDFTTDFTDGLERLRNHITWLDSPNGKLESLRDRLEYAKRDLSRVADDQRIKDDIVQLQKDIEKQQIVIIDTLAVIKKVEESIKAAQEKERQPERPVCGGSYTKIHKSSTLRYA